jgi:hypothetical protein
VVLTWFIRGVKLRHTSGEERQDMRKCTRPWRYAQEYIANTRVIVVVMKIQVIVHDSFFLEEERGGGGRWVKEEGGEVVLLGVLLLVYSKDMFLM